MIVVSTKMISRSRMRNPNPRQRKRKLGLGREMRRIPGNRKKDKKGEAEPPQGRR